MSIFPYRPNEFTQAGRAYIGLQKHTKSLSEQITTLQSQVSLLQHQYDAKKRQYIDHVSGYKAQVDRYRELLKVAACPSNCNAGAIPIGPDPDGNWEAEQCQFCYEREQALKEKP